MSNNKYEKPIIQIIKFETEVSCLTSQNFECTSTPILCYNHMENII